MRKGYWKLLIFMCLLLAFGQSVSAGVILNYENPETNYQVLVVDQADLLEEDEDAIEDILEQMDIITRYGNAMLLTVDSNSDSAEHFAQSAYYGTFGNENGCIFLIDMDNRQLMIASDGELLKKTINRSVELTITDNVFRYATNGDYHTCALMAFSQIAEKLEGGKLAAPMRYLSAFFLAILLGLMLTFVMAKMESSTEITDEKEFLKSLVMEQKMNNAKRILIRREVTKESSSDSGSSIGGGGGGGGGGGFSGSSGGHGF